MLNNRAEYMADNENANPIVEDRVISNRQVVLNFLSKLKLLPVNFLDLPYYPKSLKGTNKAFDMNNKNVQVTYGEQRRGTSYYNENEANYVISILETLLKELLSLNSANNKKNAGSCQNDSLSISIGIIAAYKPQVELIKYKIQQSLILTDRMGKCLIDCEVNSVDGFQVSWSFTS